MELKNFIDKINCKILCGASKKEYEGIYVGDFLSHVISKLPQNYIWLTIMNNVNVAGVASLSEACAIVLCENVQPDDNLLQACKKSDLTLITTNKTSYEVIRDSLT